MTINNRHVTLRVTFNNQLVNNVDCRLLRGARGARGAVLIVGLNSQCLFNKRNNC